MTSRFDQLDTATHPYGRCKSCDIGDLATQEIAQKHMIEQGHTISVLNQTRRDRIRNHVTDEVIGGMERVCERLYRLIDNGDLTVDEVRDAMRSAPDPGDEWDEYLREMGE